MRLAVQDRFFCAILAIVAFAALANCALATNVTVNINRVYQLNGNLLDINNLDYLSWADFYPWIWVGNETYDHWSGLSLGFSDTRDVYPTNWTHTWNTSTNPVEVGIRIWDSDDTYMDGEANLRPEYPKWMVQFMLDTTTGQITNPPDPFYGDPPSVVSGPPNNRQYTSSAAPEDPWGAQVWFTVQIEDTLPPEDFTAISIPSTWAQSAVVSASGGYDKLSGFNRFEFWLNGVKKYTDYSTDASHTDTQQGGNTWVIKAYDDAGNHLDKTVYTNIDTSVPWDFSLSVSPTGYTSGGATVSYAGAGDSLSGFSHFAVYLDASYWFTTDQASGSFGVAPPEGTHVVTMYEYDVAGNVLAKSVNIYIDNTAPTGPTPTVTPSTWTTGNVTVAFSATDALSGIDHYEAALDAGSYSTVTSPYTVTAEGQHTVHIKAVDKAGNSRIWDVTSRIDRTAPTGSIAVSGGAAYTDTPNVTLNLSYSDTLSGVSAMRFTNSLLVNPPWTAWEPAATTKSWTLSGGDGTKTVSVQFKDNADNTYTCADTIVLDTLPPVVTVGMPDPYITVAGPVWFPVTFNEDVTGFASPGSIQLNSTGTVAVGNVAITGSGSNYTVILSSITGTGTVGITVKAAAAVDPFGRPNAASAPSPVCQVASTMTIGIARVQHDGTAAILRDCWIYLLRDNFAYIEDMQRAAGMRVEGRMEARPPSVCNMRGTVQTNVHGEKYLALIEMSTPNEYEMPKPYGMSGASLKSGLATGLYARVWGKVLGNYTGYSLITDGATGEPIFIMTPGGLGASVDQQVRVNGAVGLVEGKRAVYLQQ